MTDIYSLALAMGAMMATITIGILWYTRDIPTEVVSQKAPPAEGQDATVKDKTSP
jgi:hypothetical protein